MKKLLVLLAVLYLTNLASAQTYTGNSGTSIGNIDNSGFDTSNFPLTVTGLGNSGIINTTYGLDSVTINLNSPYDGDLYIFLKAPDGTILPLSINEGAAGKNFTNTVFTATATTAIAAGTAPFTGTFLPEELLGALNNGQNGNGVWSLCVCDRALGSKLVGKVVNWSLTFNNTPAPPPPPMPTCTNSIVATGNCANAPMINTPVFCGAVSTVYEPPHIWPSLTNTFCGSIEGNSFVKFIATDTNAIFNIWVYNSQMGLGIQAFFFNNVCNTGTVISHGCYDEISPTIYGGFALLTATGLVVGQTYYMMFDGFAGDICNYTVQVMSGVALSNLPISLKYFTATGVGNTVKLNWHTATELNTSHFNIQHSTDGNEFKTIGTVKAVGSGANSYGFADNNPVKGTNYYLLQSVDKDGASSYSKVVSVQFAIDGLPITVYPNPVKDILTVGGNHISSVQVLDNMGRVLNTQTLHDATNPTISVVGFAKGVYHLRVITMDGKVRGVGFVKE